MDYQRLTSMEALDGAFADSHAKTVLIFKHSLTCPVSTAALREFERFLEADPAIAPTMIEVQPQRGLSNEVATRTGVRHESPQALLVRDGEVAWHGSHWDITAANLAAAVEGS